jgi:hypothetical protein
MPVYREEAAELVKKFKIAAAEEKNAIDRLAGLAASLSESDNALLATDATKALEAAINKKMDLYAKLHEFRIDKD